MRLGSYAKTIVAAVLAAAYALQAALTDDVVTTSEWVGIGLAVLTVFGVYVVPNARVSDPPAPRL
jgi:hypothetical protein